MMYCSNEEDCGYNLEFIQNPPDTFICIICNLVLRNPVQIIACGHRFCAGCFQRMKYYSVRMKTNLCCPIDGEIVDKEKVFNDTGIARDIGDFKVKCSNNQTGCPWEGEIRYLKDHLNVCDAKVFNDTGIARDIGDFKVKCSNNQTGCPWEGEIRYLKGHLNVCEAKTKETGNLLSQAFQRITECEEGLLKKGKEIAYLKINLNEIKSKNIRKDAELVEIGKELKALKESNLQDSLKLILNEIKSENIHKDAELVVMRKELKTLNDSNCQYEEEIKNLKEEHTKQSKEMKNIKNRINIFTERNIKREKDMKINVKENEKIVDVEEELSSTLIETHGRILNLENFLFYRNNTVEDIYKWKRIYKWKLVNYNYYTRMEHCVRSSIFEVRPTTYRCCFGVGWYNGDEKNVALIFRLHKGKDEYMEPFSMYISFEIIDKHGNKKNRTITPDMIQANREECFTVHPGENESREMFEFSNVLTMPEDEAYIINNALTITCTFTPAT